VPTFAVANQKGGVGKTTTVVNVGAYLGALGASVLLVDCDAQANTTGFLGVDAAGPSLYDVLIDGTPAVEAVVGTSTKGVDLLPATADLAGADIELLQGEQPNSVLKQALAPLQDRYSYIFLDCPPSLGVVTVNALVAADAVLVPVQCEYLALEGLARLMNTLDRIRAAANPSLQVFGLVMTMYDARTVLSAQVAEEVRRHYPALTFQTVIPRNVRLSEAPSFGRSILDYDPYSRGAEAYQALALEVASRVPGLQSPA
jgi:chromosome partitioning protein